VHDDRDDDTTLFPWTGIGEQQNKTTNGIKDARGVSDGTTRAAATDLNPLLDLRARARACVLARSSPSSLFLSQGAFSQAPIAAHSVCCILLIYFHHLFFNN
jgi:hypothetical protein